MESLEAKWITSAVKVCQEPSVKSPARLGLTNMRGKCPTNRTSYTLDVFILVAGGIAVGFFFSFVEVISGRRRATSR